MRIVLGTIIGLIVANAVNFGIVMISMSTTTAMQGVDMNNPEQFLEAMKNMTTADYILPLVAHLIGLLAGLIVARAICKKSRIPIYIIAGLNLVAVIYNLSTIPHPTWFAVIDVAGAAIIPLFFLRNRKR